MIKKMYGTNSIKKRQVNLLVLLLSLFNVIPAMLHTPVCCKLPILEGKALEKEDM